MSDKQKHIEALSHALKTEEEGKKLFLEAAAKTKDPFARGLFETLANDEDKHIAVIKKFYENLVNIGRWEKLSAADMADYSSEDDFKSVFHAAYDRAKEGKLEAAEEDIEAYEWALKFEDDGAEMYDKLYRESKDPNARIFYGFLRDMEMEHYDTLKRALDYLKSPNDYYILEEGWTMEH